MKDVAVQLTRAARDGAVSQDVIRTAAHAAIAWIASPWRASKQPRLLRHKLATKKPLEENPCTPAFQQIQASLDTI